MRPQWLRCAAAFLRAGKFKFGRVIPKEKARKHHGFGLFLYIYFFKCGCRLIFRSISISAHEMLMDAPLHFSSGILLCRHFAADLSGENHIPAVSAMPKDANIMFYGEHMPACRESICAFSGKSKIRRQPNWHIAIYKNLFLSDLSGIAACTKPETALTSHGRQEYG